MHVRTYICTYVQVWSGFVLCSALCVVCTRGWFCSLIPWPEPVVVLVRVVMEGRWWWKNCPRLLISLRAHTYVRTCVHTYVYENVKCVRECKMHPHKLKCILMLPCLQIQCIFQSSPPHSCCVHACHLIFCIALSMYVCMYVHWPWRYRLSVSLNSVASFGMRMLPEGTSQPVITIDDRNKQ